MRFILVGLSVLNLTLGFLAEDGVVVGNTDEANVGRIVPIGLIRLADRYLSSALIPMANLQPAGLMRSFIK